MADAVVTHALRLLRPQHDVRRLSPKQQRETLGNMLIASNDPPSEELLAAMDQILAAERVLLPLGRVLEGACWLAHGRTAVCIWRGDITSLQVGAVVNAANEQGLGCFQPAHLCIDNVLHRTAGPRLREACRCELLKRPSRLLETGTHPLVTPGFALPAKHVLHVTGPHVGAGGPTHLEQEQLASCYSLCLDAARQRELKSIAFCCISTGLFGYPQQQACEVALRTTRTWLDRHRNTLDLIVFDVFTPADHELYLKTAPVVFP